ncbi:hypothetical protein LCGC14_2173980, partial [marine sediment metagenome]
TDKLFAHLSRQLIKQGGILIIFVQLRKESNEFFAKDMISFFPSFVAKYIYNSDNDTLKGSFDVVYMRESATRNKRRTIPCTYDWDSRQLKRDDNLF